MLESGKLAIFTDDVRALWPVPTPELAAFWPYTECYMQLLPSCSTPELATSQSPYTVLYA